MFVVQYIPDPKAKVGHCVHRIAIHPKKPNVLFRQKHWDVMRSDDAGNNWYEVSGNLPSDFGVPIIVHAHEPNTIYVVPIASDSLHYPPDGKLRVYRSRTGGNQWEALTRGLPQENCYVNVLRDATAVDEHNPCGIYFGTTGGQVYASSDEGDHWLPIMLIWRSGAIRVVLTVGGLVLALSTSTARATETTNEVRTWRSRAGSSIAAEFIAVQGSAVHLRTANGEMMKIALSALSDTDRAYVASQSQPAAEPGPAATPAAAVAPPAAPPADFPYPLGTITGPIKTDAGKTSPDWSYWLYLPSTFSLERKWPVMFVMSPAGGEAGNWLNAYVDGAEWNGFILALSVESANEREGSMTAVLAMVNDVVKRFPIDDNRHYASGHSGGSRMAFKLAERGPETLAGVIACGAGHVGHVVPGRTVVYGLCGSNCFNRWDMVRTQRELRNNRNQLRFFIGGHDWARSPLLKDAMTYLNLVEREGAKSTDRAAVAERTALAEKQLRVAREETDTNAEHAFEWAVFLAAYKGAPTVQRDAAALLAELRQRPEVESYADGLKALDRFALEMFAIGPNGRQSPSEDPQRSQKANLLAKRYADTSLAPLFTRLGMKNMSVQETRALAAEAAAAQPVPAKP